MISQERPLFACPGCGRTDAWTAELAGQAVRCPCGKRFRAPDAAAPVPMPEQEPAAIDPAELSDEFSELIPLAPQLSRATGRGAGSRHAGSSPDPQTAVKRSSSSSTQGDSRPRSTSVTHHYAADRATHRGLLLLIVLVIGGGAVYFFFGHDRLTPTTLPGEDNEVTRLIADKGAQEVSSWLAKDPHHAVRGMAESVAKQTERRFLNMGAVRVLAFGAGVSEYLAVELPDDPDARRAIFEWAAGYDKGLRRTDLVPFCGDQKQRYLLLRTPEDAFTPLVR